MPAGSSSVRSTEPLAYVTSRYPAMGSPLSSEGSQSARIVRPPPAPLLSASATGAFMTAGLPNGATAADDGENCCCVGVLLIARIWNW